MRVLYVTRVYIDSIHPSHMTLPLGNYIHCMAIGEVFSLFRVAKVQALSLDDSVDESTRKPTENFLRLSLACGLAYQATG